LEFHFDILPGFREGRLCRLGRYVWGCGMREGEKMLQAEGSKCTRPKYVCGNERIKLIGATDGGFPDFGHHLEKEMGGLWLYPAKLLDGFWMRFADHESKGLVDGYMTAGEFYNYPYKNVFIYSGSTMGHTPVCVTRTQYAPDGITGIIAEFEFCLPYKSMPLPQAEKKGWHLTVDFLFKVNLRPDWLAEEMQIFDGTEDKVVYDKDTDTFCGWDNRNPWYVMVGTSIPTQSYQIGREAGPEAGKESGVSCCFTYDFILQPGEKKIIKLYMAGSLKTREDCAAEYNKLLADIDYCAKKEQRMNGLLAHTGLDVGDGRLQNVFDWLKIHTDWLTLETEGIGRGITAGIPEYVWWFGCDSCYALQGIMMQGNYEICRETMELILKFSKQYNGNGKIIHELLPNGYCPNTGNTQETAHFLTFVWDYCQWTGDREFLEEYYPYLQKSVKWLETQDDDGDYFPSGYGIIEIAGLNMEMIDTAVYACTAYECYANICELLNKEEDVAYYRKLAEDTRRAVNTEMWSEEAGLYCDCYASCDKILENADMIISQMEVAKRKNARAAFEEDFLLKKASGKREHGWLLNKNWIINLPMEMGIADEDKANRALETLHTAEFIGEYGMYLEGLRESSVMTISTGAMAVAQARYHYPDRALSLIQAMIKSFSKATPGSICEMSPDYGCFVQAWTVYGVVVPIVEYFFGIKPDAGRNRIVITPEFPDCWEDGSLTNVRVLDGELSVTVRKKGTCIISCEVVHSTSAEIVIEGDIEVKKILKT